MFLDRVERLVYKGHSYTTIVTEVDREDCSAKLRNPYLPLVELEAEAREDRVRVCSFTGISMIPHLCDPATDYLVLRFAVESVEAMDYVRLVLRHTSSSLYFCSSVKVPEQLDQLEDILLEHQLSLELLVKLMDIYKVKGCGHLDRVMKTINANSYELVREWVRQDLPVEELKKQLVSAFGKNAARLVDEILEKDRDEEELQSPPYELMRI